MRLTIIASFMIFFFTLLGCNEENLKPKVAQNLSRALVFNSVAGCTVMVNRALRNLVHSIPPYRLRIPRRVAVGERLC